MVPFPWAETAIGLRAKCIAIDACQLSVDSSIVALRIESLVYSCVILDGRPKMIICRKRVISKKLSLESGRNIKMKWLLISNSFMPKATINLALAPRRVFLQPDPVAQPRQTSQLNFRRHCGIQPPLFATMVFKKGHRGFSRRRTGEAIGKRLCENCTPGNCSELIAR